MALQQFVAWLLGRVCRAGNPKTCNHHWTRHQLAHTLYHSKGLDQRSGSTPLERSGSGVWIRGLDRLWDRGLIQTLHFEPQPYRHWDVEFTPMLPRHMSMIGPSTAALSSLLPSSIFCKYARIFSCKMRQYPLAKCNLKNITEFTIPSCSKSTVPGCLLSRINLCIIASVMRPLHGMGLGNDPT